VYKRQRGLGDVYKRQGWGVASDRGVSLSKKGIDTR
jgi:hypothetical protein